MNKTQSDRQHAHIASYYAAMQRPRALLGSLAGKVEAQVTIVGGGLAGLTAALELARRGHSVILLEAERIGWGASGRSGGFVSPGFAENIGAIERRVGAATAKQLHALSVRGVDYVENTIIAAGRSDIIGGRGWLHVSRSAKTGKLRAWRDQMVHAYGADMVFLEGGPLQSILKTDRYRAAVADQMPFHIDPLAYAELLLQLCLENGVCVFEGTRVNDIGRNGAAFVLNTRLGQVLSPNVVVATSAYGGPVRQIERSILPVATYVVASSPGGGRLADVIGYRGCIADQRRAGDYYRLVEDEKGLRLLWGGRITTRRSEPAQLAHMLLKDIRDVYPQLDGLSIEYSWSGLMGYARHKMPVIGEISSGLFALTGFGGHGLNTTAAGALVIADALNGDRSALELFGSYRAVWGGGALGRFATQLEYERLRLIDAIDEL
ncbi:MAG: FAD-binding oxidoreductase [Hyphomicrobiales bacterium]|nr:FAD-binding oxidoreductase [Hyphomicrobiales bacterium]MCP4998631.1 FAD-binding oxidoreductase [Hyphomicrobiales bacterium]